MSNILVYIHNRGMRIERRYAETNAGSAEYGILDFLWFSDLQESAALSFGPTSVLSVTEWRCVWRVAPFLIIMCPRVLHLAVTVRLVRASVSPPTDPLCNYICTYYYSAVSCANPVSKQCFYCSSSFSASEAAARMNIQ
jgi:hypothetical protein